jgi:O-methyltransferase
VLATLKKIKPRLAQLSLSPVARAVLADRLTYLSVEKLRRIDAILRETQGVPGDIVEFGVALGGSGIILAAGAKGRKRFVGFDVFETIPPPTSDKDDAMSKARYAEIAAGRSTGIGGDSYYGYRPDLLSDVTRSFTRHGVPLSDQVVLHQGLFADTWPEAGVSAMSLAHIDCDWYDPVKYCLDACADRLSVGGAIIVDDYFDYGGCRVAVDEFMAERRDFVFDKGANPILRRIGMDGTGAPGR